MAEAGEVGAGVGIFLGGEDAAAGVGDGAVGAVKELADGGEGKVREEFAAECHRDLARPGGFAMAVGTAGERGRDAVKMGDSGDEGLEGVVGESGGGRRIKIKIKIRIRTRIRTRIRS